VSKININSKIIKVAIVGSVGLPSKYGGWETLVNFLTLSSVPQNVEYTVYCSKLAFKEYPSSFNGANLVYIPLHANGVQSVPYDILSLVHASTRADLILILGVSGCIFLPFLKLFTSVPIITNIDGLEWKREKWGFFAKLFLKFSEKIAVRYSDLIISDNLVLQSHIYKTYAKKSVLISYGGDHAVHRSLSDDTLLSYDFLSSPYAFKVARIEPENNVELILNAFSLSSLPIVFVGNWNNSNFGREIRSRFSVFSHLHLLDAIYNQSVLDEIRSNSVVYIHGHSAGGTNPSLVEAMNLSLPVFAYDVDFNRETTENKAFYFSDAKDLQSLITNIDYLDMNLCACEMKEVALKRYTWDKVSSQYVDLFNQLCSPQSNG